MIQLRQLREPLYAGVTDRIVSFNLRLQYRYSYVYAQYTDGHGQSVSEKRWTDWQDVPIVDYRDIEEKKSQP